MAYQKQYFVPVAGSYLVISFILAFHYKRHKSFELQTNINPHLQKWVGIGKTVDNDVLFDPNKNLTLV